MAELKNTIRNKKPAHNEEGDTNSENTDIRFAVRTEKLGIIQIEVQFGTSHWLYNPNKLNLFTAQTSFMLTKERTTFLFACIQKSF